MPAEGHEIRAHRLHVHRQMRRMLRGIDQHHRADRVCPPRNLLDRIDRAQHIGNRRHRDQFGALREQPIERLQIQQPVVGDRRPAHHRSGSLRQLLPGHDVRMVLHLGEQNFIARLDVRLAPTVRHQIDAFGGAVREDHFLARCGIDELANFLPRFFVQIGRLIAQPMNAPMHVGVSAGVHVHHRIDHLPRSLRRGGIIQIDQRLAVGPHRTENRKIGAQPLHVEAYRNCRKSR